MAHNHFGKKLQAVLFLLFIGIVWIQSGSCTAAGKIYDFLKQEAGRSISSGAEPENEETEVLTISGIQEAYINSMQKKQDFIELSGKAASFLDMRGFYSSSGIYIADGNYIITPSEQTSTDYEFEETMQLNRFLSQKGIRLLYVNEPTKYLDDSIFRDSFGIESYSNRNADLFLSRIAQAGIPVIDLREELEKDGMNIQDMFYRTDHHWTVPSGLWASEKIAEGLNACCGYEIDTSIYDKENYTYKEWKSCWLGEQGRKVASSYVGLDDFTEIKPKFKTSYTFKKAEDAENKTFDDFINEEVYLTDTADDVYNAPSWHYSYARPDVINHNVEKGRVLILGDSYEQVVVPFLSLGISEVDSLILRGYSGSLREYIEAGDYDTVLICYAQFMIGAHDKPESANYKMFTFE